MHVSEARTGVYAEQTWRPGMPVQISPCGRSHIQLRSMSLSSVARPTSVYLNGSNANRPLINDRAVRVRIPRCQEMPRRGLTSSPPAPRECRAAFIHARDRRPHILASTIEGLRRAQSGVSACGYGTTQESIRGPQSRSSFPKYPSDILSAPRSQCVSSQIDCLLLIVDIKPNSCDPIDDRDLGPRIARTRISLNKPAVHSARCVTTE